jgi:hypothetical protein
VAVGKRRRFDRELVEFECAVGSSRGKISAAIA